ncbi:hypothetical protein [Nocardioides plantarum]|uniref:Secreted protein n=1 Tax=Nocardioides plantarum TaxID=29299 RepID=A0ABV5K7U0_9ACTN|nr:hypothetical protein [Nocardioides plantarum]
MKITTPAALALTAAALVVASSTAGYAGARFGSADIRDGSLTSIDIKNGSISVGDLTPGTIRKLDVGRAYATVTRVETATGLVTRLDPQRTYGFSKLKHATEGTGTWCLVPSPGVDLSHSAILVSADFSLSMSIPTVLWVSDGSSCASKEIEIHTTTWAGDDEPSPSDDVAFQVLAS